MIPKRLLGKMLENPDPLKTIIQEGMRMAKGPSAAPAGSALTLEEWWARHAALLAVKMQQSGVKSFHVERMPCGKFAFDVMPEE